MRKTAISALSLSLACMLALVGCKPSSTPASAPSAPPVAPSSQAAVTPPGQTVAPPASQAVVAPQAANAQQSSTSPMTPGLWEITMQSDAMRKQPQISPQQAEQMRKMGMNVPEIRNGGMVMKVCYTKEMLAKNDVPTQNDQECKPTNMSRSGSSFSGQIVCDGPNMKGTGTVQGTVTSTSIQTSTSFKGTMGGQPVSHQNQTSGTFIGADCGSVKPIGQR